MQHRIRFVVLGLWMLFLVNCASTMPSPNIQPTQSKPLLPMTPTAIPEAELLLNESAERYCTFHSHEHRDDACYTAFALKIAKYIVQHPNDPHNLALWRRIIELGLFSPDGSTPPSVSFIGWAFDPWVELEAHTAQLSTDPIPYPTTLNTVPEIILTPVNLDHDPKQDYIVEVDFSSYAGINRMVSWMHWEENTWNSEFLTSFTQSSSRIIAHDITNDGLEDLIIDNVWCGASVCGHDVVFQTWDGKQWHPLNPWSQQNHWDIDVIDSTVLITATDFLPIQYAFNGEVIAPTRLISPVAGYVSSTGNQLKWGHAMLQTHQYKDAITYFNQAIATTPINAHIGYNSEVEDARPMAFFRLGFTYLLIGDVITAQQTWQRLIEQHPTSPVTKTVQRLNLMSFTGKVTELCTMLQAYNPSWFDDHISTWINNHGFNHLNWYSLCNPILLVPSQSWSLSQPITDQMNLFGLPWQELSAHYDLNDDGINDVIGVVDYLDMLTPWAMLSSGQIYHPLYANQPWGIDTPFSSVTVDDPWIHDHQQAQATDLDHNGIPEILLFQSHRVLVLAWHDHRFELDIAYFDNQYDSWGYTPTIALEQQENGQTSIIARLEPDGIHVPHPDYFSYGLQDTQLYRIYPPQYDQYWQRGSTNAAAKALFIDNNPEEALAILDVFDLFDPETPGYPQSERLVLRAMALETSGQVEAANQVWERVATAVKATGWRLLARER